MPPDAHHGASMLELLEKLSNGVKQLKPPKEILESAEQVLAEFPGDEDALRFKLVALVRDDDFENALSVIDSTGLSSNLDLKAYCLFRFGRFDEALDVLRGLERSSFRLQLEAQVYYKKQDLDACTSCYRELLSAGNADEEVQANAIAAFLSARKSDELFNLMDAHGFGKAAESYDLAYNSACALIARGELSQAEEHLLLSRKMGQEKLMNEEDGYTVEDVEDELAAVNVQMAYVQQMQGRSSEAAEGYLSVLARNLLDKDAPSVVVATNNLAATRRNKEASDSLRKLEAFLEKDGKHVRFPESLLKQLSESQREAIMFNYFLLLLTLNKNNQARELISTITNEFPGSTISYILRACLYFKEGKLPKAEEALGEYVEKTAAASADALLLCAQARASAGHFLPASESLERVQEAKHMPAMVATIVDLKQRGEDLEGAENVLDAAVDWWSKSMEDDKQGFLEVLSHKAAELKLMKKKFEDAAKLYDRLASSSSGSARIEAFTGLVCCYAETDLAKAESYERQLPPLEDVAALDVDALERAAAFLPAEGAAAVKGKTLQEKADERTKKKRKRKPRYPKGYDPENPGPPPDPERWLPMRERSYYRPRKKDKRAAARGSQGAVAKEAAAAAVVSNGPASTGRSNEASSSSSNARGKNRRRGRR